MHPVIQCLREQTQEAKLAQHPPTRMGHVFDMLFELWRLDDNTAFAQARDEILLHSYAYHAWLEHTNSSMARNDPKHTCMKIARYIAKQHYAIHIKPHLTTKGVARWYTRWLRGYIQHGGRPDSYVHSRIPCRSQASFRVIRRSIQVLPLTGYPDISLIVPENVSVSTNREAAPKCICIFDMYVLDGFRTNAEKVVVYKNTTF